MPRIALAVAVLLVAITLALAVPRFVAGDTPGCPSWNFSKDCAPAGQSAPPAGGGGTIVAPPPR